MQILGHEFALHGEFFSDEDYEETPWYDEGMAEYLSHWEVLTESEFAKKAEVERLLVELLTPQFGSSVPALGTRENYAAFFYGCWRAFVATQKRVDGAVKKVPTQQKRVARGGGSLLFVV